jgi:hypothetical protein
VPYALSDAQKGENVNLSRRLLRMLEVQRNRAWQDISTVDEPRSYLSTDYEFIWLPRDEKFPKENDTQFNRKVMLTIDWNPRGVHLTKVLEKGRKFNAGYYVAWAIRRSRSPLSISYHHIESLLLSASMRTPRYRTKIKSS